MTDTTTVPSVSPCNFDEWWEQEGIKDASGQVLAALELLRPRIARCWSAAACAEHRRLRELMEGMFKDRQIAYEGRKGDNHQ